jgi:hypothetical protein
MASEPVALGQISVSAAPFFHSAVSSSRAASYLDRTTADTYSLLHPVTAVASGYGAAPTATHSPIYASGYGSAPAAALSHQHQPATYLIHPTAAAYPHHPIQSAAFHPTAAIHTSSAIHPAAVQTTAAVQQSLLDPRRCRPPMYQCVVDEIRRLLKEIHEDIRTS